jgi:hypothetical protein
VEHGRPGSGVARQGRCRRGRAGQSGAPSGPSGVRTGLGRQCENLVAAIVHVEAMREREAGERKGKARPGTIPAYVRRADTSADEHKQAGLRGSRGALCSSTTR